MKSKIKVLLVLALVTFMFVACGEKSVDETSKETVTQEEVVDTTNTTLKELTGEGYSFKLNVPNDWSEVTIPNTKIAYLISEDGSNVNLVVESTQGYTLEKYADAALKGVKEVLNVSEIERLSKKIGEIDVVIGKYKLAEREIYQVVLVKDDHANIFTLASTNQEFENNIEELENTLKTLEFME